MLGKSLTLPKKSGIPLQFVNDDMVLYMPTRGSHSEELQFLGEGSCSFDGTDDYITCGTGIGTALGDDYAGGITVSLWFKADVFETVGLFSISAMDGGSDEEPLTFKLSATEIIFRTQGGGHTDESKLTYSTTGVWVHAVGILDATNFCAETMKSSDAP